MEEIDINKLAKSSINLLGNFSGVYFLFDNNELVYTGKGCNVLLRIAEHTSKDSFKKFTSWNFIQINDKNEYNRLEKKLIERFRFKPKYNKTNK